MKNEPLISVIMPIYNAEKRLNKSIDSILNQKYKNIELILVNDGSKDNSREICDKYKEKDSRVKVINQVNSGVSCARNRGIEKAKGEFLTFIDSDDTLESQTYEEVIDKLSNNDADIIIFGMSFDYYKKGFLFSKIEMSINDDCIFLNEKIKDHFFCLYEKNYLSSVCNKLIKSSILKEKNIQFEEKMIILEDFKFVLDILKHTKKIIATNTVYYHYYNDIIVSSLSKRPNRDYMQNFKMLDYRLKCFSEEIGLISNKSYQRVNGLILRYYLIGIEKIFSSSISRTKKYNELMRYIADEDVKKVISEAKCNGKRLQIIHWLMKKNLVKMLWFLFLTNESWKKLKRRLKLM